jgi:hypothetical protein
MRTRTILLVVAILLVAGFAALNWSEMVHSTPLSFGVAVMDAPLGLLLLCLLGLTLVLFLASTAAMRTQSLMEYRQHQKTLEAQRDLADKAEASRYTDLRGQLDQHLKQMHERDAIAASEFDKAMLQSRREIQAQMEQMNRMISARFNEIEQHLGVARPAAASAARSDTVAAADEARLREEERLRDERIRENREVYREERATAKDKPTESGWRKWF